MIKAGSSKPTPFDIVLVHSFSRFFRDHFELEFYVRKLAKNGCFSRSGLRKCWHPSSIAVRNEPSVGANTSPN